MTVNVLYYSVPNWQSQCTVLQSGGENLIVLYGKQYRIQCTWIKILPKIPFFFSLLSELNNCYLRILCKYSFQIKIIWSSRLYINSYKYSKNIFKWLNIRLFQSLKLISNISKDFFQLRKYIKDFFLRIMKT